MTQDAEQDSSGDENTVSKRESLVNWIRVYQPFQILGLLAIGIAIGTFFLNQSANTAQDERIDDTSGALCKALGVSREDCNDTLGDLSDSVRSESKKNRVPSPGVERGTSNGSSPDNSDNDRSVNEGTDDNLPDAGNSGSTGENGTGQGSSNDGQEGDGGDGGGEQPPINPPQQPPGGSESGDNDGGLGGTLQGVGEAAGGAVEGATGIAGQAVNDLCDEIRNPLPGVC